MMMPVESAVCQPRAAAVGEVEDVSLDDDKEELDDYSDESDDEPLPKTRLPGRSLDGRPPPRVIASRGLSGIFDPSSAPEKEQGSRNAVFLNVYDVSESELIQRINRLTTANDAILAGGVFHAGVEVYGKEWCYGATEPGRTGVGAVLPRMHPQHRYRATVYMGTTDISPEDISRILAGMAPQWPGCHYNLIHHNCLTFCNSVLEEKLSLRRIPGWVDRAARIASQVDMTVQRVKNLSAEEVQGQASEALDVIRRDSLAALEVAREESQKIMELAQASVAESVSEFQASASVVAEPLAAEVQEGAKELGAKATEFVGAAQEQIKGLGASIWQWGQELQDTVAASSAANSRQSVVAPSFDDAVVSVAELGKHAEEQVKALSDNFWMWGQEITKDLKTSFEGPNDKVRRDKDHKVHRSKHKKIEPRPSEQEQKQSSQHLPVVEAPVLDLLGDMFDREDRGADAIPVFDPRGTAGLIREQETRLLTQGLLADQDELDDQEEESPASAAPRRAVPSGSAPRQRPSPKALIEAPADWGSSLGAPASVPARAPLPEEPDPFDSLVQAPITASTFSPPPRENRLDPLAASSPPVVDLLS
ncbi:unnamed protein product [Polarella glacialis]|uniref:PPPDE domain-containing protein n=1 Tax=Polarella glacialis TaxID=89957 RepID=A0A813HHV9_POLGL|nr:unnamed protein product [Polarella glacialis]CAE8675240.1 unnamed protein product [Polarella glacialis]